MTIGPVQLLVLGFEDQEFTGEIMAEVEKLREHDVVRLVDLLVVRKDEAGEVDVIQASDLSEDEAIEFGATVGALIGLGAAGEEGAEAGALAGAAELADGHAFDESQVWYVADSIPPGTVAAVALLEHRWALPLREAILKKGGMLLADAWVHPVDLVAAGLLASEEAAQLHSD
jgi:uncharacterized membrane protein